MTYKAANDLLELVNAVFEGKLLFIGKTTEDTFSVIKTLDNNTGVELFDDQQLNIKESYCQQIFLDTKKPVIINDSRLHPFTRQLPITRDLNIHSYIGVPIFYKNGDMFGTLCALDSKTSNYSQKDVEILERFSNLFSYVIELEKQLKTDSLTGLYNRSYLHDNFEFIAEEGALMLLDLDGFKQVNDTYGHDVGDLVLTEVGQRIKKIISPDDLAVRLGGDEFVLLFPNQKEIRSIKEIGMKLTDSLSDWNDFEHPISVSASIGIVQFPQEGTDLKMLLKKADTAMYKAKTSGKNACYHYQSAIL